MERLLDVFGQHGMHARNPEFMSAPRDVHSRAEAYICQSEKHALACFLISTSSQSCHHFTHMRFSTPIHRTTSSGTTPSLLQRCCTLATRLLHRDIISGGFHGRASANAALRTLSDSTFCAIPGEALHSWRLQRVVERWSIPRYLNFFAHFIPHRLRLAHRRYPLNDTPAFALRVDFNCTPEY
jgi:hypothetical protein